MKQTNKTIKTEFSKESSFLKKNIDENIDEIINEEIDESVIKVLDEQNHETAYSINRDFKIMHNLYRMDVYINNLDPESFKGFRMIDERTFNFLLNYLEQPKLCFEVLFNYGEKSEIINKSYDGYFIHNQIIKISLGADLHEHVVNVQLKHDEIHQCNYDISNK